MKSINRILENTRYHPSDNCKAIHTIDMHTAGEPLRVIVEGYPEIKGNTILEYRNYIKDHLDHFRKALMSEPRGHADMYGCLLTPPVSKEADFGIIFIHNEGYSTMCGHATIAIAKLAVEMNWVDRVEPVTSIKIDAPCGLINARISITEGQITAVAFDNVPSFVVSLDNLIEIEELGPVTYDLAYGGAFYALVNSDKLGIELIPQNCQTLIDTGMKIKKALVMNNKIKHPFEEDLSFLYGTIFIGGPVSDGADSRNVCVFADGEVDRSPTGSGVSARMAIHYKRNEIQKHEWMKIESILGSSFKCCVKDVVTYGEFDAVIPTVVGNAFVTGQHEFLIDPDDPMKEGFILR